MQGGGSDVLNEFYKKYNVMMLLCRQHRLPDGRLVPQGDQDRRRSQRPQVPHRRLPRPRDARSSAACRSRSPRGDIYPALEKGTIDAAEWVGPYDDEKLGFYKVAQHYYYAGWWEGGSMLVAFINLDKWNALPKNYQAILRDAAAYANNWMLAKYDLVNPPALKRLIANGAKLHAFSPAIMEACFKAAHELHDEIAKTNASFKKVYDSMKAFQGAGYPWFQVAELNYDSFMIRHHRGLIGRCNEEPRSCGSGVFLLRANVAAISAAGRSRAAAAARSAEFRSSPCSDRSSTARPCSA